MRALALLVAIAGCGRFGFGGSDKADGATADGVVGDGASGDGVIPDDSTLSDGSTGDAATACSPAWGVCDGFENFAIDTATWTVGNQVTLDTTRAHRGNKSVHVHTPAFVANTSSYITIYETKTLAPAPATFWVRGWFWLSALPAAGNGLELISAERPGAGGDYVFVFNNGTHIYTQWDTDSQISATTVPLASWFCVVFKVVRTTAQTGSLEMTGDLPTLQLPNVITDGSNRMTLVVLGMGFSSSNTPSNQPTLDLWIDDVIVDDGPVTCAD